MSPSLKILDARCWLSSLPTKSNDLKSVEKTIKLLTEYHAVPSNNEQFVKRYKALLTMYHNLCQLKGKIPNV